MRSDSLSWIVSGIGGIVFTGLTAYDTWKIKDTEHSLKRRVLYEF